MNKDEFSLRSEATTDKQTDKFIKEFKLWVGGFFTKNLRHSSYIKSRLPKKVADGLLELLKICHWFYIENDIPTINYYHS